MSKDFASLVAKALQVRDHYDELQEKDGKKKWGVTERMSGFVGDVGALSKLIMAKQGLRRAPDELDAKLSHEVVDCLWSLMVIADELGIDLELEFNKTMSELNDRIERQKLDSTII